VIKVLLFLLAIGFITYILSFSTCKSWICVFMSNYSNTTGVTSGAGTANSLNKTTCVYSRLLVWFVLFKLSNYRSMSF
jgi:hypothetical protein